MRNHNVVKIGDVSLQIEDLRRWLELQMVFGDVGDHPIVTRAVEWDPPPSDDDDDENQLALKRDLLKSKLETSRSALLAAHILNYYLLNNDGVTYLHLAVIFEGIRVEGREPHSSDEEIDQAISRVRGRYGHHIRALEYAELLSQKKTRLEGAVGQSINFGPQKP